MNKIKAKKLVMRKIQRALPCPFCGKVPDFDARVDRNHSANGSLGHYAIRQPCCKTTGLGQTELFFCNNWKTADYRLWKRMVDSLINAWNQRAP